MRGNVDVGLDRTLGAGEITGSGTATFIPVFTGATSIGDSILRSNGVSVYSGTATPSASALLDLTSTSQGFLAPRMTTAQRNAIASPATSLFVYNTSTSLFNYFDGVTWQAIDSTATSEWLLDGNSNGVVRYIGTNDTVDFPIYTDGVEAGRFLASNQFFGIGTTAPTERLMVEGNIAPATTASYTLGTTLLRWTTLYLASTVDYSSNLLFTSSSTTRVTFSTTGNVTIEDGLLNVNRAAGSIISIASAGSFRILDFTDTAVVTSRIFSAAFSTYLNYWATRHVYDNVANTGIEAFGVKLSDTSGSFQVNNNSAFSLIFASTDVLGRKNVMIGNGTASYTTILQSVGINSATTDYAFKSQDIALVDLFNVRNDGSIGVGILASTGRFHTFGMLSNINQRIEPVTGVIEDISGATVATTDATTTTLQTIAIPTNTIHMIECRITARKTAGAGVGTVGDGNGYIRTATYANIAGVVTLSGVVQASYTGEGIVAFSATLTISGTNVLVSVTGAVSDDVTWNIITRIERVG